MRKILIVGATSAIAEATARLFAVRGDALFLVARDTERLRAIKADLDVRGAMRCAIATLDVTDFAAHAAVLDAAERELGGIDTVLIAHGTLSEQPEYEKSIDSLRREFDINALSTMALLTPLANLFEARKAGTLAVISSVAGDRGRQSNYVYGAAKAAVSAFLSGLRQRLAKSNVDVLTIKPGFVATPMTAGLALPSALTVSPARVASDIDAAINSRKSVLYTAWFWCWIMLVIKLIPSSIFKKLRL